jgi:hypothetical protein
VREQRQRAEYCDSLLTRSHFLEENGGATASPKGPPSGSVAAAPRDQKERAILKEWRERPGLSFALAAA